MEVRVGRASLGPKSVSLSVFRGPMWLYLACRAVSADVPGRQCGPVCPSLPDTPSSLCLLVEVLRANLRRTALISCESGGRTLAPPHFPPGERTSRSRVLFGLEPSGACIDPLIVRGLCLTSLLPGKPSPWRPGPLPQRRIVNSCRQRPGSLGRGPLRPGAQGERPPRRGPI